MLHLLNAVRAFEVAARLGSVSKAADELHVTSGAVSRHIKNLEDEFGISLFERGNRSMRLTPEARTFAATVTEAFASMTRGAEHLRAAAQQVEPRMRKLVRGVLADFAAQGEGGCSEQRRATLVEPAVSVQVES